MRILIIHSRYSQVGGEEMVVETQKRILSDAGHDVLTYIRDYHEMNTWKLGKVQSLFSSLYSLRSVKEIREIISNFRPEVAIVHNLFPIISAAILKELKNNGVALAMTIHNYRLLCPTGLFFRNGSICTKCAEKTSREFCCFTNKCQGSFAGSLAFSLRGFWSRKKGYFNYIDRFMSVSQFQKTNLVKYGINEEKIEVIPNCVSKSNKSEKKNYVAFIGRLSHEKGIDLLFEIAKKVPEIHFKVAGGLASGYTLPPIPDNIEIMGHISGKQLNNLYSEALALIFTSKVWEAMPLSPLEAMASGTVVVANRVSSIPEILDDGNAGIIFQSADEGARKLREIISDKNLRTRLENVSIERINNLYSEKEYLISIERVLKTITNKK